MLGLVSCFDLPEGFSGEGLRPIYLDEDDFSLISTQGPRESEDQGLVLEVDNFIYINERFKGIHVFDNTDLSNPIKTYFWNIPGNTEFSIVGNELFADNSRHLIVLDISDKSDIQYVSHVEDVYTEDRQNENFPDNYFGWFECVDFEKGIVIDWEEAFLEDANCRIGR